MKKGDRGAVEEAPFAQDDRIGFVGVGPCACPIPMTGLSAKLQDERPWGGCPYLNIHAIRLFTDVVFLLPKCVKVPKVICQESRGEMFA